MNHLQDPDVTSLSHLTIKPWIKILLSFLRPESYTKNILLRYYSFYMDKYLYFQGGREKAIFTFMIQQINTEKIDIFTTLGTCSVLALAILCLVKKMLL